jgi:hypothetical protein
MSIRGGLEVLLSCGVSEQRPLSKLTVCECCHWLRGTEGPGPATDNLTTAEITAFTPRQPSPKLTNFTS